MAEIYSAFLDYRLAMLGLAPLRSRWPLLQYGPSLVGLYNVHVKKGWAERCLNGRRGEMVSDLPKCAVVHSCRLA